MHSYDYLNCDSSGSQYCDCPFCLAQDQDTNRRNPDDRLRSLERYAYEDSDTAERYEHELLRAGRVRESLESLAGRTPMEYLAYRNLWEACDGTPYSIMVHMEFPNHLNRYREYYVLTQHDSERALLYLVYHHGGGRFGNILSYFIGRGFQLAGPGPTHSEETFPESISFSRFINFSIVDTIDTNRDVYGMNRRNPDVDLRTLERNWSESGTEEAFARYASALFRAGILWEAGLPPEALEKWMLSEGNLLRVELETMAEKLRASTPEGVWLETSITSYPYPIRPYPIRGKGDRGIRLFMLIARGDSFDKGHTGSSGLQLSITTDGEKQIEITNEHHLIRYPETRAWAASSYRQLPGWIRTLQNYDPNWWLDAY